MSSFGMLPSGSTKLYYRSEGQIILRPHLITSKELRCDTFTPYVTQWCYTYVYGDDDNDEYCNNINSSKLYWCLSLIIGINLVTYMQTHTHTHTHTHIYKYKNAYIYMRTGKFLSAQALEYTLLQHFRWAISLSSWPVFPWKTDILQLCLETVVCLIYLQTQG